MSNKSEIKHAKKDKLDDSYLLPENAKVRVNMFVDGDVLKVVREEALKQKTKYQTLINQTLRQVFCGKDSPLKIREKVDELTKRIEHLEEELSGKRKTRKSA